MVPILTLRIRAPFLRPLKEWALAMERSPRLRRAGWRLIKVFLFFATFLAAWLMNVKVAGTEPARAPDPGAPRAPAPAGGPAPAAPAPGFDGLAHGDLALTVAERWRSKMGEAERSPDADPGLLRVRIYDIAIGASALAGASEDPRRRMEAVSREIFERRGFRVLAPPEAGFGPREILIDEVLGRKAGSPLGILTVYLAVAELLTPPLDLGPLVVPSGAAARFQDGGISLSVLITPSERGPVLRDDLLRSRGGDGAPLSGEIKPLTKGELAGELLRQLARSALERGAGETALALLGESAAACPRRKEPWVDLAEVHRRGGDAARERTALDQVLTLEPDDGKALARRAALLIAASDLDGAERDIRRALEKDPRPPAEALLVLGDLEGERGRLDRAIAAYRRFLSTDPPAPLRSRVTAKVQDLEIRPSLAILKGRREYPERFEALRRIAAARAPGSIEVLIDALHDGNLRFARLAWRTLQDLTGQEIGFDAEAWERWSRESQKATAAHRQ